AAVPRPHAEGPAARLRTEHRAAAHHRDRGLLAAALSGRGHARALPRRAPTRSGPTGPGPRRAAAHHRPAGRAGRGLPPGGVRRPLRHPPPGMPAPDLLQPRRHPPPRHGAAAHQAGLPHRGPRDRERGAAGPPAGGARVRRRARSRARREDPALEPSRRRAAPPAPGGHRLPVAGRPGRAVRHPAAPGRRRPRRGAQARRGGARGGDRGPGGLRARRRRRRPRGADLRLERLRLGRRRPRTCPRGPVERTTLMTDATTLQLLPWVVCPYMVLAVFVLGHVWRFRHDGFGWTTRSSQIYESKLLSIGSPMFHYGIIGIFVGHVVGLGIPKSWTRFFGI